MFCTISWITDLRTNTRHKNTLFLTNLFIFEVYHQPTPYRLPYDYHQTTSLLVQIGPPLFDGGSKLSSILIEWDVSTSFDSSQDRAALGSGRIYASNTICTKCVTKFDAISNAIHYEGNISITQKLIPQRTISIRFVDNMVIYTFNIVLP